MSKNPEELVAALGRPTLYKQEYCAKLIEHMASGMTFESFAGHPMIQVNRDTLYEWVKNYPEFSDAKTIGRSRQLYADEQVLNNLTIGYYGKEGKPASHIFKMKNCHGWKDKSEIESINTEKPWEVYIKELGENNGDS